MSNNIENFQNHLNETTPIPLEQESIQKVNDLPTDLGLHENEIHGQLIRDVILPQEMVHRSIERACDFFGIPIVPTIKASFVGEGNFDIRTLTDDVFLFNRKQLMNMGIKGEDSLTLVYAHECAHRILQLFPKCDPWIEELACDFFAAVLAGIEGIDATQFKEALCYDEGTDIHPAGFLRGEFIEFARSFAENIKNNGIACTFALCLDAFNKHVREHIQDIMKARSVTTIVEGTYNYDGLNLFVNDQEWNLKQSRINQEKADNLRNEARQEIAKGNISHAKDLNKSAEQYESKAKDYRDSASQCTK